MAGDPSLHPLPSWDPPQRSPADSGEITGLHCHRMSHGWRTGLPALLFLLVYREVFAALAAQWSATDMYSYGFLIPVISLYLVWSRRGSLAILPIRQNLVGGTVVMGTGLLLFTVGRLGGVLAIEEISLIATLSGLILLLLGTRFLRALGMPLAYLLFMIPVWDMLTERLHFPFQNFSAGIGVTILQALGIPAYRQGVYIELPQITLEVARVCSGINYLIAVIAIGIPMVYLFLRSWPRRIVLMGTAVGIAILGNGARVALIGILAYYDLHSDVHGPFHVLEGLFVSALGFLALFTGVWLLSDRPARRSRQAFPADLSNRNAPVRDRSFAWGTTLAMVPLLLAMGLQWHQPSPVPLEKPLTLFPLKIGPWEGFNTPPVERYRPPGVDQELSRIYQTKNGEAVRLYIGYFEYQTQGKELVGYPVEDLFHKAAPVPRESDPSLPPMKRLPAPEGPLKETAYYWFDLNNRRVTDPRLVQAITAWNALTRWETRGALIVVSTSIPGPDVGTEISGDVRDFIIRINPWIRSALQPL